MGETSLSHVALIPNISARYDALIELTRESVLLEERLKPITAEMNSFPLRVNKETWRKNLAAAEESAWFLTDYCRYLTNDDLFRPNSRTDCVGAFVAKDRKLDSTDKDALTELAVKGDSLASAIIEARSAISRWSQLKKWGTYAEAGTVQSYWDSMGTPTGRYSCEAPCLTNRIGLIRATIEPPEGWTFLSFDLSQAEYVTWASLAGDEVLGAAFKEGRDFHADMAQKAKELVPEWNPGEDLRHAGKTLNFSILYQMKPWTLARRLGCPLETAEKIISAYYSRVPKAALYIDDTLARAEEFGYVETYYGRRRYCPEYQHATGPKETHELGKTLWSHVNQGTAAEVTKLKQTRVWEALRRDGLTTNHVRIAIQMFDEIILAVRDDRMAEVREIGEAAWKEQEPNFLPFRTKVQEGKNWEEASR